MTKPRQIQHFDISVGKKNNSNNNDDNKESDFLTLFLHYVFFNTIVE